MRPIRRVGAGRAGQARQRIAQQQRQQSADAQADAAEQRAEAQHRQPGGSAPRARPPATPQKFASIEPRTYRSSAAIVQPASPANTTAAVNRVHTSRRSTSTSATAGSSPASVIGSADAASPAPRGSSAVGGARSSVRNWTPECPAMPLPTWPEQLGDGRAAAGGDQQGAAVGPERDAAVHVAVADRSAARRPGSRRLEGARRIPLEDVGDWPTGRRGRRADRHVVRLRARGGHREAIATIAITTASARTIPVARSAGRGFMGGGSVMGVLRKRLRCHGCSAFSSDVEFRPDPSVIGAKYSTAIEMIPSTYGPTSE